MNLWAGLRPSAPFVLPEDRAIVATFNQRASERTRIQTRLLPEPFVGRLDAPVVLLALNPGVSPGDFALHRQPGFVRRVRDCHVQRPARWPYYYLDPAVAGPGARWSARVLAPLIRERGAEAVAQNVVLFEYLPYHSRAFGHRRLDLPSQAFTMAAVNAALAGARAVFVTRGFALWSAAIPGLTSHPRLFRTRSTQNIVVSPGNCPDGFDAALDALRGR